MAVVGIATQNTASMMAAVTGIPFTPDVVMKVGDRINNLARAFNRTTGLMPADSSLTTGSGGGTGVRGRCSPPLVVAAGFISSVTGVD